MLLQIVVTVVRSVDITREIRSSDIGVLLVACRRWRAPARAGNSISHVGTFSAVSALVPAEIIVVCPYEKKAACALLAPELAVLRRENVKMPFWVILFFLVVNHPEVTPLVSDALLIA